MGKELRGSLLGWERRFRPGSRIISKDGYCEEPEVPKHTSLQQSQILGQVSRVAKLVSTPYGLLSHFKRVERKASDRLYVASDLAFI